MTSHAYTPGGNKAPIIELLVAAGVILAAKIGFEFASVLGFVYRGSSLDQPLIAFLIIGIVLIAVIGFSIIRLLQRKFLEGAVLLGLCALPFLLPPLFNAPYWKFRINKTEYLKAIEADPSPPPKYQIFHWGNENIPLGGVIYGAIVYDETDKIIENPKLRSQDWPGHARLNIPDDRWITAEIPRCKRSVVPYDEHFYYVSLVCT